MSEVTLSSVRINPACGILREAARPVAMRDASYAAKYDWSTLFYDVYRAGPHVVFQGPPDRKSVV